MALNDRLVEQRTIRILLSLKHQYIRHLTSKIKLKKEIAEESAFNCRTGGQVALNFNLFSIWTRAMMKAFNTSMQGLEHFKFVSSRTI